MPDRTAEYTRGLAAARDMDRAVGRRVQGRVLAAFAETLRRLAGDHPSRAEDLAPFAKRLLVAFESEFAAATEAGLSLTIGRIVEIHEAVTASITRRVLGESVRLEYARLEPVIYAQLAFRRGSRDFRSLLARRIRDDVFPVIDSVISSAAGSGVGPGRLAREIATILANDNPDLLELIPSRSTLHRGVGQIDFEALGARPSQVAPLKSLLYDSRRIAVSEVNNALRESNAVAMTESPVVGAAAWSISGNHPEADECDVLAETDFYGFGEGMYPPDAWPGAPHPHCGCYQGAVIFRPLSEWTKPKRPTGPPKLNPRRPEVYGKWAGDWTEKRVERARRVVTTVVTEVTPLRRRAA